ncbi:MAG: hypothetical protein ACRDTS_15905, partial [Mycobacterium sp.]
MRTTFGAVLFIAWGIETIIWVYGAIHSLADGDASPAIRAVGALLLMLVLACMEGLEVAVIDRWPDLYPERSSSELAGWLAARQLFVALIVTTATILADRDSIAIPGWSTVYTGHLALKVFDITWTGFTVLWFMQIFPKHLAATNPDRYLKYTQGPLFPVVEVVRKSGIPLPGAWVASAVERSLDWYAAEPSIEEVPARRGESLADIWATLIPERAPATRRRPYD